MTHRDLAATAILAVASTTILLILFWWSVILIHAVFRWVRLRLRIRRIAREIRKMQQQGEPVIRFR